jgi:hypothetical protein
MLNRIITLSKPNQPANTICISQYDNKQACNAERTKCTKSKWQVFVKNGLIHSNLNILNVRGVACKLVWWMDTTKCLPQKGRYYSATITLEPLFYNECRKEKRKRRRRTFDQITCNAYELKIAINILMVLSN